jgi:hypothetical protein
LIAQPKNLVNQPDRSYLTLTKENLSLIHLIISKKGLDRKYGPGYLGRNLGAMVFFFFGQIKLLGRGAAWRR